MSSEKVRSNSPPPETTNSGEESESATQQEYPQDETSEFDDCDVSLSARSSLSEQSFPGEVNFDHISSTNLTLFVDTNEPYIHVMVGENEAALPDVMAEGWDGDPETPIAEVADFAANWLQDTPGSSPSHAS